MERNCHLLKGIKLSYPGHLFQGEMTGHLGGHWWNSTAISSLLHYIHENYFFIVVSFDTFLKHIKIGFVWPQRRAAALFLSISFSLSENKGKMHIYMSCQYIKCTINDIKYSKPKKSHIETY